MFVYSENKDILKIVHYNENKNNEKLFSYSSNTPSAKKHKNH